MEGSEAVQRVDIDIVQAIIEALDLQEEDGRLLQSFLRDPQCRSMAGLAGGSEGSRATIMQSLVLLGSQADELSPESLAQVAEKDTRLDYYLRNDANWIWDSLKALLKKREWFFPAPVFSSLQVSREPLTIGILGDWGSGNPQAQTSLDALVHCCEHLLERRIDILIHLGDVYYTGTCNQHEEKFAKPLIGKAELRRWGTQVYNVAGNHDYYSGTEGFYHGLSLLQEEQMTDQKSSSFVLGYGPWTIHGLDTAYFDRNPLATATGKGVGKLRPDDIGFHRDHMGKGAIFLSHHELFSRISCIDGDSPLNRPLADQVSDMLPQVRLWLWGHMHHMQIYEPYSVGGTYVRGRLVGNSSQPTLHNEIKDPDPSLKEPLPKIEPWTDIKMSSAHENGSVRAVYHTGFAILSLDETKCREQYFEIIPQDRAGKDHKIATVFDNEVSLE